MNNNIVHFHPVPHADQYQSQQLGNNVVGTSVVKCPQSVLGLGLQGGSKTGQERSWTRRHANKDIDSTPTQAVQPSAHITTTTKYSSLSGSTRRVVSQYLIGTQHARRSYVGPSIIHYACSTTAHQHPFPIPSIKHPPPRPPPTIPLYTKHH